MSTLKDDPNVGRASRSWRFVGALFIFSSSLLMGGQTALATEEVDVELVLLADVSRSVDAREFALQRDGLAAAFSAPHFSERNLHGRARGRIAVTLVYWSSPGFNKVVVPWTSIADDRGATAFSKEILNSSPSENGLQLAGRPFDGTTAPGSAITFGLSLFADEKVTGSRRVMLVLGDGVENAGVSTAQSRDAALAGGVDAIHAIAVGSETLKQWFSENVQGGKGAFTSGTQSFDQLPAVIKEKIDMILLTRQSNRF